MEIRDFETDFLPQNNEFTNNPEIFRPCNYGE